MCYLHVLFQPMVNILVLWLYIALILWIIEIQLKYNKIVLFALEYQYFRLIYSTYYLKLNGNISVFCP